jgi:cytochrome o ubiquinol oxidase subunit II
LIARRLLGITRLASLALLAPLGGCSRRMALLDPAGPIGAHEKSVILIALGLMLIVVVPVFLMTFGFAWHYRASNKKATYAPKWAESTGIEATIWLVPALIVSALAALAWSTTHALSPYHSLAAAQKPVHVDVVAMDWKWLFIYPDQHIATVNQLVFPAGAPLSLRLTSDAVTSSFFIPRLGTQIYAMPGMETKLHLEADKPGTYTGRNFQLSGRGYAWMRFQAVATSPRDFAAWAKKVEDSPQKLDAATLAAIEKPSIANPVTYYAGAPPQLFDRVINQVMTGKPLAASLPRSTSHNSNGA